MILTLFSFGPQADQGFIALKNILLIIFQNNGRIFQNIGSKLAVIIFKQELVQLTVILYSGMIMRYGLMVDSHVIGGDVSPYTVGIVCLAVENEESMVF